MISGMRPPRPAYTPSPNGNPYICDMTAVSQRRHPVSGKWQSRLQDMLTPSSPHAYAMGCAIITLLLLTVLLIFYFLGEISCSFIFICPFPTLSQDGQTDSTLFVSVPLPVQQGGAIRMLTEAVREKETAATELSLLIQELQALRHNLTAMRGGT